MYWILLNDSLSLSRDFMNLWKVYTAEAYEKWIT